MDLNTYACQGGYLLSPGCMLVPQRATEIYWPVTGLIGVVDCRELPEEVCTRILQEVQTKFFSFVPLAEAMRVGLPQLASRRPYLNPDALHPQR